MILPTYVLVKVILPTYFPWILPTYVLVNMILPTYVLSRFYQRTSLKFYQKTGTRPII